MAEALATLRFPKFLGLVSNPDPRDIPPGAAEDQENVSTRVPGKLSVRGGIQPYTFASSASIGSGYNTFRQLSFCRSRFGDLFGVNGIDAPFRWDGMTAAVEEAGVRAPTTAPSVTASAGGSATEGSYDFYYRYLDDTEPNPIPGNLSPVRTLTGVMDNDKFDWSGIPASLPGRAHQVELWRSTAYTDVSPNVVYRVATLNEGTTTFLDTFSDTTLNASSDEATLKILLEDGSLNANRFVPPPDDRPIMVMFQDRYWFGSQVNYNRGTVTTNGTTTLTGSGTDWTTQMAGRYIAIDGETAPLEITAASATSITLASAAGTSAAGKSYVIYPDPTGRRKILYSEVDEPESVPEVNTVTIQENTGDDDEITGLIPRGAYLFVMTDRHRYALSFARQPRIDANVSLIDDRGLLNQRCWTSFDDMVFCLDESGPYAFVGAGKSLPLDDAIHDLWRNDTIDLSKKDKFFVVCDRDQERVKFFVSFAGDTDDLPTRALVYNVRTQTWDRFQYPQQIGCAVQVRIDGALRLLLGGENSDIHLSEEGTTDVVTAEIRGTATAATASTLTDSTAAFTDAVLGAPVYLYEGTGKGQWRKITARTATELTVSPDWTTTPSTDSKYLVGAVQWSWKSGRLPYVRSEENNERSVRLAFNPTSGDYRADLRFYQNYDASPEAHVAPLDNQGGSVYVDKDHLEDVVFKLEQDQSGLEDKVGYEQWRFDGKVADRMHTDRCVSIELRGFQGDEAIALDDVEIVGVVGGE